MSIKSINDLYLMLLRDMYSGEKQLTKALKKLADASVSPDLQEAFTSHLQETEGQVERLEKIFEMLDEKPGGETCEAMEGLVEEGEEMIDEAEDEVRDAGLIAAAQKVEHYEIASYGTLCAYAKMMGLREQEQLLQETLEEEKAADKKLNDIALKQANKMAKAA